MGRPLTAAGITFGCQMNAKDSEKLIGILEQIGFEMIEDESADLVFYNTCTVRDNANQRVYGRLGLIHSMKKKNPHKKVALCGCMMQEPSVIEKIQKSYRFVDLIFGTHNIYKFAELLVTMYSSDSMIIDIWKDTDKLWKICQQSENILLNQVSILCTGAITFAVIVLSRMYADVKEAAIPKILSKK